MTTEQKSQILSLRDSGHGYADIAVRLGISKDTVKSFCRRNGAAGVRAAKRTEGRNHCPQCGKKLIQAEKQKPRRFCSDQCRQAWWNAHPERVKQKAVYLSISSNCKSRQARVKRGQMAEPHPSQQSKQRGIQADPPLF